MQRITKKDLEKVEALRDEMSNQAVVAEIKRIAGKRKEADLSKYQGKEIIVIIAEKRSEGYEELNIKKIRIARQTGKAIGYVNFLGNICYINFRDIIAVII